LLAIAAEPAEKPDARLLALECNTAPTRVSQSVSDAPNGCAASIAQCEALGEYAMAEQIREILVQEQDHQIDLATALDEEVPNINTGPRRGTFRKRR
jgi:hypothetical protein